MMNALQPLRTQLFLHDRLFLNCLDGMTDEAAQRRITPQTNNAMFVALHLVDARVYLARELGSALEHPFGADFERVRNIDEMPYWPALEAVKGAWRKVSLALHPLLEGLTEAELATETGAKFPVDDRSLLGTLAFLVHHEAYHIGQLSLLRKAAGLPAMKYGRPG